jgi:hypothetical protein
MFSKVNSSPSLTNCILWGDTPDEISLENSTITVAGRLAWDEQHRRRSDVCRRFRATVARLTVHRRRRQHRGTRRHGGPRRGRKHDRAHSLRSRRQPSLCRRHRHIGYGLRRPADRGHGRL